MERWSGKIAVVTGASSGIGASTAVELVKAGLIVIGLARRDNRIEELKKDLPELLKKNLYPMKCDVSKEEEIVKTFAEIEEKFGGVDVLINNAGIGRPTTLIDSNNSIPIREVVDTNILGLVFCTREAVISMQKRDFAGHIIHINSVAGHQVPNINIPGFSFNIYPATKHAVTALTETLRQDLNKLKSKIKVTSISPGGVKTEIVSDEIIKAVEAGKLHFPMLEAVDIAEAVLYALSTPPRVQVSTVKTLRAGHPLSWKLVRDGIEIPANEIRMKMNSSKMEILSPGRNPIFWTVECVFIQIQLLKAGKFETTILKTKTFVNDRVNF